MKRELFLERFWTCIMEEKMSRLMKDAVRAEGREYSVYQSRSTYVEVSVTVASGCHHSTF
jgi:hypothetical protein